MSAGRVHISQSENSILTVGQSEASKLTVDQSEASKLTVDQSEASILTVDQWQVEYDVGRRTGQGFIPLTPITKTVWTSAVEAVAEYCRIVWDIFPRGDR